MAEATDWDDCEPVGVSEISMTKSTRNPAEYVEVVALDEENATRPSETAQGEILR